MQQSYHFEDIFFQSMAKEINNIVIMYLNSGQDIDDDKNRYE